MNRAGEGERLAATDLHVPAGVHEELEHRNVADLQLLKHSPDDILGRVGLSGV